MNKMLYNQIFKKISVLFDSPNTRKILYPTIGEKLNKYDITLQLKNTKFKNSFYEIFNNVRNAPNIMLVEKS